MGFRFSFAPAPCDWRSSYIPRNTRCRDQDDWRDIQQSDYAQLSVGAALKQPLKPSLRRVQDFDRAALPAFLQPWVALNKMFGLAPVMNARRIGGAPGCLRLRSV